ncbi:MAG TPA: hypothetical protein VK427_21715, partial [Kofleriaceae bacterium]|nr:hypothetical protein [Kofleriaceae bacterium]
MAEKNTESTAINQLIELVATAKPLPPDPSEDVMFRDPPQGKASTPRPTKTMQMSAPRMPSSAAVGTASARGRGPTGTEQGLQTLRSRPPGVRLPSSPPSVPTLRAAAATSPGHAPLTVDDRDQIEDIELTDPDAGPGRTVPGMAALRPSAPPVHDTRPTIPTLPRPPQVPSAAPAPAQTLPAAPTVQVSMTLQMAAAAMTAAPNVPTTRASSPPVVPAAPLRARTDSASSFSSSAPAS